MAGAVESVMPSTSTLLYGLVDGGIGSTLWESVTSSTAFVPSPVLGMSCQEKRNGSRVPGCIWP